MLFEYWYSYYSNEKKNLLGSSLQHNEIELHQIFKSFRRRIAYLLEGAVKFLKEQV